MPKTNHSVINGLTPWTSVTISQFKLLLLRHKWEIIILTLVLFLADFWVLLINLDDYIARGGIIDPGRGPVWIDLFPPNLIKASIPAFWGLWIWRDEAPRQRSTFWLMPVKRTYHQLIRIIIGGIILLVMVLIAWYSGIGIAAMAGIVEGMMAGFLPPVYWILLFLAYLNIYLFASILTLLINQPVRWFFLYLPLIILAVFGIWLIVNWNPLRTLFGIILPPYGLLGGLGVSLWDEWGNLIRPSIWAPMIWFVLLATSVTIAASRHQEP